MTWEVLGGGWGRAQGTQRRALGGSGFHILSAGQLAPLLPAAWASSVLASVNKQEVPGKRDPEPGRCPTFGNTERQSRLWLEMNVD